MSNCASLLLSDVPIDQATIATRVKRNVVRGINPRTTAILRRDEILPTVGGMTFERERFYVAYICP